MNYKLYFILKYIKRNESPKNQKPTFVLLLKGPLLSPIKIMSEITHIKILKVPMIVYGLE